MTILQYKEIIEAIKIAHNIDLQNHAMTSLRQNFTYMMANSKYNNHSSFLNGIKNDRLFLEQIVSNIYNEHISLFRDPAMWRVLKTDILGKILPKNPLRIWLPEVSKGSDFFTLLLLLEMDKLLENSKIIISDQCFINLENCKKGNIDNSIIENSFSNFKRFSPNSDITKYVVQEGKKYQIKKELLKNIFTLRGSFMEIKLPYKPNLVLFRNRLIYYNHVKEQKAINQLYETMAAGGFLITGVKENISMFEIDKKFRIYQQEEQIYKRNF